MDSARLAGQKAPKAYLPLLPLLHWDFKCMPSCLIFTCVLGVLMFVGQELIACDISSATSHLYLVLVPMNLYILPCA